MPDLRIDNIGQLGLNSDISPHLLPPNALTTAIDVAMEDNSVRSATGERLVYEPVGGVWDDRPLLDVRPLYHQSWVNQSNQRQWVIISDGVDVWAYAIPGDGVGMKITPTDDDTLTGTAEPWTNGYVSFAILNGLLVVNSTTNGLFYWNASETEPLLAATGWDPTWRCYQIAAYRYQLVALGMIEGVDEYPHKIRWSNSAQEGALPIQWDILLTNDAGDDILGETEGKIVGAVNVRDQLFIIKEDAVYGMRYIGGQYINSVTRLEGGVGTRNPKGFCEMRGALVVLTTSDVYLFDGQNTKSLVDRRGRKAIFSELSEENWDNCQVWFNQYTSRLYLGYPTTDTSAFIRRSTVYNLEEDTFTTYTMRNIYGFDIGYVSATAEDVPRWDEFTPSSPPRWVDSGSWDEQIDGSWNKGVSQPSLPDTLMYESNDDDTKWWLVVRNISDTNSDGSPKKCVAGRRGIPVEGANGIVQLNWAWPEIDGKIEDADGNEIPMYMRFGSQNTMNGAVSWDPIQYPVFPGMTETLDPRISGRYLAWEISSLGIGSWTMSALTLRWENAGEN